MIGLTLLRIRLAGTFALCQPGVFSARLALLLNNTPHLSDQPFPIIISVRGPAYWFPPLFQHFSCSSIIPMTHTIRSGLNFKPLKDTQINMCYLFTNRFGKLWFMSVKNSFFPPPVKNSINYYCTVIEHGFPLNDRHLMSWEYAWLSPLFEK